MTVVDTVDVDKVIQQAKQSIKSNQAHQNLQRKKVSYSEHSNQVHQ